MYQSHTPKCHDKVRKMWTSVLRHQTTLNIYKNLLPYSTPYSSPGMTSPDSWFTVLSNSRLPRESVLRNCLSSSLMISITCHGFSKAINTHQMDWQKQKKDTHTHTHTLTVNYRKTPTSVWQIRQKI